MPGANDFLVVDTNVEHGAASNHVRVYGKDRSKGEFILIVPSYGRGVEDYTEEYESTITTRLAQAGYRVVLVQPRGIGKSTGDLTPANASMSMFAQDLRASMDALEIDRAHFIGHAFGNRLARTFATLYPDRVDRVILMASGGNFAMTQEQETNLQNCFNMKLDPEKRLASIKTSFFAEGHDPRVWFNGWYPKLAAAQTLAGRMVNGEFFKRAGGKPILLMQAKEDYIAPPEKAGRILKSELGDQVTYLELEHCGHALSSERPEEISRAVINYLRRETLPADPAMLMAGEGARADAIYFGGPILTMIEDGDRAEALAVRNGRITAVGLLSEVMAHQGPDTRLVDLQGKTLMPGFFDPHSHVAPQSAKFATANLDPKPIGETSSIADIQRILKAWIKDKNLKPGQWVIGWGYDDTGIAEQRHPNRDDLDAVSTEHPILLVHISAHIVTGNSRMLSAAGITAATKDPAGGVIQRKPGSKEPNGVLEENAKLLIMDHLPKPTPEHAMTLIENGLRYYTEAGITTAQDCMSSKGTVRLFQALEAQGRLPIDLIAWPRYSTVDDATLDAMVAAKGATGRFRIGGIKMTLDGSIQGYTGFLSEPYYVQPAAKEVVPDTCDTEHVERTFLADDEKSLAEKPEPPPTSGKGYRGYANMTQEQVEQVIERCDDHGLQFQAHTNGDAATDLLLAAVEAVRGARPRPDLRSIIVHAQMMRDDQLDAAARHGLTPSFFPYHVYFWGDRHRDQFIGPERAARIDPARSALNRKLKVTLHHDAPIVGVSMLNVAWAAVNRVTSSGKLLGPEERITPFEAFRAITADAAWQNFEEARKGTLEAGKLADMVVLSADPLAIDSMKIKDIQVLQTIKEGNAVYTRE
jgi:predicted amidohydrolase YtcJ/pimeloyl-ACP methyl ester carboxylesterase